jgi:hypothetical protein
MRGSDPGIAGTRQARRHVEALENDASLGLSYSHSAYMDEEGRLTGRLLVSGPEYPSLRRLILRNCIGNGSTAVVRAEAFRTAGVFDETLRSCEDWEMWVRLLRDTSYRAGLIPEALTFYRINAHSLSMHFDGFLAGAEAAASKIAADTPDVPGRLVRRGLAMSYRIAATKALHSGQRATCRRLLIRALKICPWLLFTDPRLLPTLCLLVVPHRVLAPLHRLLARLRPGRAVDPAFASRLPQIRQE